MKVSTSRYLPVLLAGLAILAAGCSAAGSASSGGTVTASAPPASPPPASAPPASPPPASPPPASPPACATSQLTLRIGGGLVSGGADIYYLYFTNSSRTPCLLDGYPRVAAVAGPDPSASPVGAGAQQAATWPADPQLLTPGRTAQATLRFARTGNFTAAHCQHVDVLFIKILPPGTTGALTGGIDEQICAQATLPTMTITTVIPDL